MRQLLTGDEYTIKPDRMVARFVEQATHRGYNPQKLTSLVIEAGRLLQPEFPNLTPRLLDQCNYS